MSFGPKCNFHDTGVKIHFQKKSENIYLSVKRVVTQSADGIKVTVPYDNSAGGDQTFLITSVPAVRYTRHTYPHTAHYNIHTTPYIHHTHIHIHHHTLYHTHTHIHTPSHNVLYTHAHTPSHTILYTHTYTIMHCTIHTHIYIHHHKLYHTPTLTPWHNISHTHILYYTLSNTPHQTHTQPTYTHIAPNTDYTTHTFTTHARAHTHTSCFYINSIWIDFFSQNHNIFVYFRAVMIALIL